MKYLLFISLFISQTNSFSQTYAPIFGDTTNTGQQISISSFNHMSSNAFNNAFINKFIYGGYISSDIKNYTQSQLGNLNSFGGQSTQSLEYINYDLNLIKKHPKLGIIVSIKDVNLVSTNTSSDLFNTIFYGNSPYIGDTMDFSYSHYQYLHFQKYSIGLIHKSLNSSLQVGFVTGNKAIEYRLGNTWSYTSPLSDSVNFNLNGEGYVTDSTKSYFSPKGYGFSLDFKHNLIYDNQKGKKQIISFELNNIGMIFWNDRTKYQFVDSANSYSGFELSNLINADTSTSLYSMDTLGIYTRTGSKYKLLPFEVSIQKLANRNSDQKLQLTLGFKALITSDFRPYIYVGGYYSPNKKLALSTRLAYGGFGGFKLGLNANYFIKDKIEISIGSYDMVGFISEKYGYGKSLHFLTRIKF